MNYYQDELTAKHNRQRVEQDFKIIHIEERANATAANHPSLLTRTMHSVATWMILTGKELHTRYELPTAHTHRKPSSSFAR